MCKLIVNSAGKTKRVSKDEAKKLVSSGIWTYASKRLAHKRN